VETETAAVPAGEARTAGDPRVAEARAAIEAGLPDAAWVLLEQLTGRMDAELLVLRARAALAGGDGVGALREVEDARALHPEDPDVAGTGIEVLAVLDRLPSAEDALREALKRFGRQAVLERARGVLLLRTGGKGREALAALEAARELDPDLAFVAFPLAQARGLAGRAALGEGKPEEALALARAALAAEPADPDLRELAADSLAALLDFEGALAIQDELAAEGRGHASTRAGLHQKLATRLLLEHRRAESIEHYLAARDLGLDDEGLGFGTTVLAEEARAAIERGIAAFERGELDAAQGEFRAALRLVPSDLEARNHLGLVRFRLEDYAGAVELWQGVLDGAEERAIALPEPVHLNLARALRLAGDVPRARALLEGYLASAPEGEFAAETRELLARLDLEAPSGR
jgi:tetratricopeptide (TPR) repeat protein